MSYVSGFLPSVILPQTVAASDVGLQVDMQTARAVLGAMRGLQAHPKLKYTLNRVANEHHLLRSYEGMLTYERAMSFLDELAADAPTPDISVDPDGEVAFDWADNDGNMFSVSLGASGRLSWAADRDDELTSGESFFGGSIPEAIRDSIGAFR